MTIIYDVTYELKDNLGFVNSVEPLAFNSVNSLKEQMLKDFDNDGYRVADLTITFNSHTRIYYSWPNRIDIYMLDGDVSVRLLKTSMNFWDFLHTIEEYANYDY